MSSVKKITTTAICTALCYILPPAFHAVGLGTALSPMHLPVLLCGLVCGWPYGTFCGLAGPVLASLLSGMPPVARLLYMAPELMAYGFFTGLLFQRIRTGQFYADLYLALVPSLLLGRIVGGVAQALVLLSSAQPYSVSLWAGAYLVGTLPAVVLQLVLLPVLVTVLTRAHLVPERYPGAKQRV